MNRVLGIGYKMRCFCFGDQLLSFAVQTGGYARLQHCLTAVKCQNRAQLIVENENKCGLGEGVYYDSQNKRIGSKFGSFSL